MFLPDAPCHIIQRDNNRDACFFAKQDYQFYLDCLYDASHRYHIKIHAYVLMTNHVHLLTTPLKKIQSVCLCSLPVGVRNIEELARFERVDSRLAWSMLSLIFWP